MNYFHSGNTNLITLEYRLLDSLVVKCWLRVREVPGSIPSHGPQYVIQMVPVVSLFSPEHSKLALSQELR